MFIIFILRRIAIDTFSDLVVHPNRYNFKVSLKTYLFMIGRCRAIDFLRRGKIINFVELSKGEDAADDRKTLEEMVLMDEKKSMINNAISKLPEGMKTAVHLIYFEEMSYEEAAKVMKKTNKQVDNLLYRAKKELRTILGKDGENIL